MIVAGRVLYGADEAIKAWVADHIPGYIPSPQGKALGVITGGKLAAGVLYERFNGVAVEVAIAADPGSKWADRSVLRAMFSYPFEQLGCEVITVACAMSNLVAVNLATKLGFSPVALIKFAAHDGGALVILQLQKSECRWLGDGQVRKQRTGRA